MMQGSHTFAYTQLLPDVQQKLDMLWNVLAFARESEEGDYVGEVDGADIYVEAYLRGVKSVLGERAFDREAFGYSASAVLDVCSFCLWLGVTAESMRDLVLPIPKRKRDPLPEITGHGGNDA